MMKNKTRALSWLLCLTLVLGLFSGAALTALAAPGSPSGGESFDLVYSSDTVGVPYKTVQVASGESLTAYAGESLPKEGYTFVGWSTRDEMVYHYRMTQPDSAKSPEDAAEYPCVLFDFDKETMTGALTLYPVYVQDRLEVHLHLQAYDIIAISNNYSWYDQTAYTDQSTAADMPVGGDGYGQARQFRVNVNEKVDMTAMKEATRSGYTLAGWYTSGGVKWNADWGVTPEYCDKDAGGNPIKQEAPGLNYSYYTVTLSAHWTPNAIPVVYTVGEHGAGSAPAAGTTLALGNSVSLPKGPAAASGYYFVGWTDAKNALHGPGEVFHFDNWDLISNDGEKDVLAFTAKYEEKTASMVTFDSDGGSYVAPVSGTTISEPAAPTKKGYLFDGWYQGDTKVTFPLTLGAEDITLAAHWKAEEYTIRFVTYGGSEIDPITASAGTSLTKPANPTREHSAFTGWSPAFPAAMPEENLTLSAQWKPLSYQVTFNANGGSFQGETAASKVITDIYGAELAAPELSERSGYDFAGWTLDGQDAQVPAYMPDTNPTYVAKWTEKTGENPSGPDAGNYTVTIGSAEHGKVTADRETAAENEKITLTVAPSAGYRLDSLTVTTASAQSVETTENQDGTYSFVMPAASVTVTALFAADQNPFTDVPADAWYVDAVQYCFEKDYFRGTSDDKFSPGGTMTRAMFATVLYRVAGKPSVSGDNPFPDVQDNEWYTDPVIWAAGQKVIEGYNDGRFGTNDPVTREQMVVLFWRYHGKPAASASSLSAFSDAASISDWAKDAFPWAVSAGIINGKGNGLLDPKGTATRAEVARIVMNYDTMED